MQEKFNLEKIFKKNTEKSIMTIIKFSPEDIRIENARKFLGIGDFKLRNEILDCFLILLKNLPISFFKLFDDFDISNSFAIPLEACFEIQTSKFQFYNLNLETFDRLLRCSQIYKNDKEYINIGIDVRKDAYLLDRYYKKSNKMFDMLVGEFKTNKKNHESTYVIAEHIILANKEFEISLSVCLEVIKRNFKVNQEKVSLQSFFEYFLDKYIFKARVMDFVQISLETFIDIYSELEKRISKIWENSMFDNQAQGVIFYRDFYKILANIMSNSDNLWKFPEYFKYIFFIKIF